MEMEQKSIIFANVPLFQPNSQRTKKKRPLGFDLTTNFQNEIMNHSSITISFNVELHARNWTHLLGIDNKNTHAVMQIDNIHTPIVNNFITSFSYILKKNTNIKFDKKKKKKTYQSFVVNRAQRERERGVKGFACEQLWCFLLRKNDSFFATSVDP